MLSHASNLGGRPLCCRSSTRCNQLFDGETMLVVPAKLFLPEKCEVCIIPPGRTPQERGSCHVLKQQLSLLVVRIDKGVKVDHGVLEVLEVPVDLHQYTNKNAFGIVLI